MSTEIVRQFLLAISSDSPLQAAQLFEDQLSEDALESVVGGVLNEAVAGGNSLDIKLRDQWLPRPGGNGSIPIPGPIPGPGPGPLG
jgi:hypothetical protein